MKKLYWFLAGICSLSVLFVLNIFMLGIGASTEVEAANDFILFDDEAMSEVPDAAEFGVVEVDAVGPMLVEEDVKDITPSAFVVSPIVIETPVVTEIVVEMPVASEMPAPRIPRDNIQIAGKTISVVDVADTGVDSGDHVNHIGRLLYGHNSALVFGGLSGMKLGDTFFVTLDGVVRQYTIVDITLYEKNADNGRLQLDGGGSYMKSIRDRARGHDLALMTCAGTMYGNGDASHRLVILADVM